MRETLLRQNAAIQYRTPRSKNKICSTQQVHSYLPYPSDSLRHVLHMLGVRRVLESDVMQRLVRCAQERSQEPQVLLNHLLKRDTICLPLWGGGGSTPVETHTNLKEKPIIRPCRVHVKYACHSPISERALPARPYFSITHECTISTHDRVRVSGLFRLASRFCCKCML